MFVDMSFFQVDPAWCDQFETLYADVVHQARDAEGCISSDLIRLTEIDRYCWVERWVNRDAHQQFNEFLFGDIVPGLPDEMSHYVVRLENRDAEGVAIDDRQAV